MYPNVTRTYRAIVFTPFKSLLFCGIVAGTAEDVHMTSPAIKIDWREIPGSHSNEAAFLEITNSSTK